jgi:hypothetical protein
MEWKWTSAVVSLAFVVATLYNQIAEKGHVVADSCCYICFSFGPPLILQFNFAHSSI